MYTLRELKYFGIKKNILLKTIKTIGNKSDEYGHSV